MNTLSRVALAGNQCNLGITERKCSPASGMEYLC